MAEAVRQDLPAPSFPLMTVDEFWAQPARSGGVTYELVNGRLRAQDAASVSHGSIQGNLVWLIKHHLRTVASRCHLVVAPGVRPLLNANWNHRIPELAVTCAPPKTNQRHIEDPILIVEILSPSNRDDTWSNVPLYATLPSVREILLVESDQVGAELLRRGADGVWPADTAKMRPADGIQLATIDLVLPFAEIYASTALADEAARLALSPERPASAAT